MNKLISVIIPVYNVERYLHQCVDSVLAQTYTNLEIILVDDGSPDTSPAICDEYAQKDKRIKVIHKDNGGLSSARNAGLDAATGDFIYFLDSDDILHPDCIKILFEIGCKEKADIVSSSFESFLNDQTPNICHIAAIEYQTMNASQTLEILCRDNAPGLMSSCMKIYKKDCFRAIRFPLNTLYEDAHTNFKIYYVCKKICYTNTSLYYYRLRPNSIMANTHSLVYNLDAFEKRYLFLKERHEKAANYCIEQLCWDFLLTSIQPPTFFENNTFISNPKQAIEKFKLYSQDFLLLKQGSIIHRLMIRVFLALPSLYKTLYKISPWHIRKPYQHLK